MNARARLKNKTKKSLINLYNSNKQLWLSYKTNQFHHLIPQRIQHLLILLLSTSHLKKMRSKLIVRIIKAKLLINSFCNNLGKIFNLSEVEWTY